MLLANGCATTRDPGWTGHDATPFGDADRTCRETAPPDGSRDAAYESCMREQGWTR